MCETFYYSIDRKTIRMCEIDEGRPPIQLPNELLYMITKPMEDADRIALALSGTFDGFASFFNTKWWCVFISKQHFMVLTNTIFYWLLIFLLTGIRKRSQLITSTIFSLVQLLGTDTWISTSAFLWISQRSMPIVVIGSLPSFFLKSSGKLRT